MLESSFIFSEKGTAPDGYGHVIHNSMCLGRPMLIKAKSYAGKLAEPLLIENETYLEIDENLPNKIRSITKEKLEWMGRKCHERFNEIVDFDKEYTEKLKPFFANLI